MPRAAASAARKRRCSSSTRAARRGSAPSVARRSASGSSESSRTTRRKCPFGQTADEHTVEVEPQAERDVSHEDALTETTDPAEVGVELELERPAEHIDARCRLDRVEPREALERGFDLVGRALLGLGPLHPPRVACEELVHDVSRPARELAPAGTGAGTTGECRAELADERVELARGLELVPVPVGTSLAVGRIELLGELRLQHPRMRVEPVAPLGGAPDHAPRSG